MIKCIFSEKLYEILCINELLKKISGACVYCPSQQKEAKVGYDALFNIKHSRKVLIFQFKIPEKYKRNPIEFKNSPESFKFNLHSKNQYFQHNRLVYYNKSGKYIALYCAPKFVDMNKLYEYYAKDAILTNSLFAMPYSKITDNNYHYINYDYNCAYQHSKSKEEIKILSNNDVQRMIRNLEEVGLEEFRHIVEKNGENSVYFLI